MLKPNEFQILVLWIALVPLFAWNYRDIDWRGKPWFAAGFLTLLGSYAATVLEGFWAPTFFNAAEHFLYAATGILFAASFSAFLKPSSPDSEVDL